MFNRRLTAALVATTLLAITGCGGGRDGDAAAKNGDAAATKAPVAMKSSYAAKADAICAVANKKEAAAGAPGPGWIYRPEFDDVHFLKRFNAAGREALRKLRALKRPATQRHSAAVMVAAIAKMVHALDGRMADLQAHKGNASDRARVYIDGYSDLTPAAAVLGVSQCQGVSL
jgi:hypothetical protein